MLSNSPVHRAGSSLCEVLVALTIASAVAGVALSVTAASERIVGQVRLDRAALHRASLALAAVHAAPCDSMILAHTVVEPRWRVTTTRDVQRRATRDRVWVRTARGDTLSRRASGWCS